jgi:hypothetical protein
MHSDLAEANVTSIGGGKYVLTFTDDATNHGSVFILKNKSASMVLSAFQEYIPHNEKKGTVCGDTYSQN